MAAMVVSTDDIKRSIAHKIASGRYPVGRTLPSCRQLARDLGINRNTASRIYQDLAGEGLVKAVRGRGIVVVRQHSAAGEPIPAVHDSLLATAREARLLGMDREAFVRAALEAADELYLSQRPAIAFVECNVQDLKSLGQQIEAELLFPVERILVSAVEESGAASVATYGTICTTLYHWAQVSSALGDDAQKLVAVHAPPDPWALLEIARLSPGLRIGIVCAQPRTREYLANAVHMVHPGEIRTCLLSEAEALAQLQDAVDVVVDVPSCHADVASLIREVPIITVGFRLDVNSMAPLRERLARQLADQPATQ
jgi:GntR family transcriptional regulator